MKKVIIFAFIAIGLCIFNSCKDQYDFSMDKLSTNFEQETNLALPLVNASMTLEEILPDDEEADRYLIIEDDGFIRIQFDYDIREFTANEYFNGDYSGTELPYINETIDPQVFDIGLDDILTDGEFYLANPKITLIIKNYWDVPAQFRFTDFYYYEESDSPGLPFTGSLVSSWISVERPTGAGEFAITEIVLDTTSSNIDEVISAMPHHISFGANLETITDPPVSYDIDPNSTDSVKLNVDIPLDLRVANLILQDTVDFNLGEEIGEDTSMIESLTLNLLLDNGFPIDIQGQIYFTDENYNITDSVSTEGINILAGEVTSGKVTSSTSSQITVDIEGSKMSNILNATNIIINIVFNTANASSGESVKLYSDYALGLRINARVLLKLKT